MTSVLLVGATGTLGGRIANKLLGAEILWTGSEWPARGAIIVADVWKTTPFMALLLLGGLALVPDELHEAAKVDGASGLATFRHITIPLLMRFIQFAFVLTLITGFTALFSLIFVMTSGGPGFGTTTLEFYVYQTAFAQGEFGYAAAVGVVLFVIVFGISLIQLRLLRDRSD